MKTIKLNRIIAFTSILIIMLFNNPMFSQGLPGEGEDVNDVVVAPIDQDIWLGLIGGCLIGAYLLLKKTKSVYNN